MALSPCVGLSTVQMSRMAHGGRVQRSIVTVRWQAIGRSRSELELEPSEEVLETWIWRLDQLISLGFDSPCAAQMADDTEVDLAQARRRSHSAARSKPPRASSSSSTSHRAEGPAAALSLGPARGSNSCRPDCESETDARG